MATGFLTGLASYGLNVFPQYVPTTLYQGNVFFVGNNNASTQFGTASVDDPSYGKTPSLPFNTINYAFTKCYPNQGDVIVVLPGHVETVSAASGTGSLTFGVAGVTVLGIGNRVNRPKIYLSTATTATINVTAANVALYNVKVDSTGIDAVAVAITVSAGGFYMESCEHYFAKTSFCTIKGISTTTAAAGSYLTINNCYFHGDAVANCTSYFQCVGGDSISITNSYIVGNFTTSLGIFNNITAAVTNILFDNCKLANLTASSTKCIVCLTGSTGFVNKTDMQVLTGTAPITMDGGVWCGGNYSAATIATGSTLV